MELSTYLTIVRRWWWTLLVAVWVAGLSGFLIASRLEPIYETQARVLVGPMSSDLNTLRASGQLAQTYAELAVSQPTLARVIQEVGMNSTPAELAPFITAQADAETRLVTITAQAGSPELAVGIAESIAGQLDALDEGEQVMPEGAVTVVDPAVLPDVPVAPQVSLIVALASVAGLAGALLLVVLIDYFSDTVSVRKDLEEFDAPFLGAVRRPPRPPRGAEPLIVRAAPSSAAANDYRLIAADFAYGEQSVARSILVVGVQSSDSSGLAAGNLAAALSVLGKRVLIIDADGSRRTVSRLFGLADAPGISEALKRPSGPIETTRRWGVNVIGFGRPDDGAGNQLDAVEVERFLGRAIAAFDVVVISVPPIHDHVSALLWTRLADATVVMVQRDRTKRRDLARLLAAIEQADGERVGVVLLEDGQVQDRSRPVQAEGPRQVQPAISGRKGR